MVDFDGTTFTGGSYDGPTDDSRNDSGGSDDSDDDTDSTAGGGTSSNPAPGLGGGGGVSDTSPDDDDSNSDSDNPFGGDSGVSTPDIRPDNDNPFEDSGPSTPSPPSADNDNPFEDSGSSGGGSSGSSGSGGGDDDSDSPPVGNTPSSGNLPSQDGGSSNGGSGGDSDSPPVGNTPDSGNLPSQDGGGGNSGSGSDNPFGGDSGVSTPDIRPDNDNPFDDGESSGGSSAGGGDGSDTPAGNTPDSGNLPGGQPDPDQGRDPDNIESGPVSEDTTPQQGIEETGDPAAQQAGQRAEEQYQEQFESQTGRSLDDEDVRVTTEQRDGQTVAVPELTESGEEQLQFERNQRSLAVRREAIAQIDQQTEADLTAGDDIVFDDGQARLSEQGRVKEAAAQTDGVGEEDLDIVGGDVVLDTGDTDVSPDTPGTGEDTARSQVVEQLEAQTGVDLSEGDVEFSETDDGGVQGQLSDQGEKTVAAANAPFSDVPAVGAVTSGGAVANEQIKDATDPAAEAFDSVTPDKQDAFDAAGAAVDTATDVDIPFTDTDFGDVDELAPEDQSPEGVNPAIFAAQVEAEQRLNDVSEAEARERVAEDAAAIEQSTVEEFSPAVGRSPASGINTARGIAGIAGITGGAVAVNEITRPEDEDQSELPVNDPTAGQNELAVNNDPTGSEAGEVTVPDEVGQAAGEITVDVTQDEPVDPSQLQVGSTVIDQGTGDGILDQPEPSITDEEVEQGRVTDESPLGERDLPDVVVPGESTGSDAADDIVDEAQQPAVDQPTDTDVGTGAGTGAGSGVAPGVGTGDGTGVGNLPGVDAGVGVGPAVGVGTGLGNPADVLPEQVPDIAQPSANASGTGDLNIDAQAEEVVQEPVPAFGASPSFGASSRLRLPRFGEDDDDDDVTAFSFGEDSEVFDTGVVQDIDEALGR